MNTCLRNSLSNIFQIQFTKGILGIILLLGFSAFSCSILQAQTELQLNSSLTQPATGVTVSNIGACTPFYYNLDYGVVSLTEQANNAELRIPLLGLEYVDIGTNPDIMTATTVGTAPNDELVVVFVDPLPAGSSGTVTIELQFPCGSTCNGTLINVGATITADNAPDVSTGPDDITATVSPIMPDISISGMDYNVSQEQGTFDLNLDNQNPVPDENGLYNIEFELELPTGATIADCGTDGCAGNAALVCTQVGNTVTWSSTVSDIPTTPDDWGDCGVYDVVINLPQATFSPGTSILLTQNVTADIGDGCGTYMDSASETFTIPSIVYDVSCDGSYTLFGGANSRATMPGSTDVRYQTNVQNNSNIEVYDLTTTLNIPSANFINVTNIELEAILEPNGQPIDMYYTTNLNPTFTFGNSRTTAGDYTFPTLAASEYITGIRFIINGPSIPNANIAQYRYFSDILTVGRDGTPVSTITYQQFLDSDCYNKRAIETVCPCPVGITCFEESPQYVGYDSVGNEVANSSSSDCAHELPLVDPTIVTSNSSKSIIDPKTSYAPGDTIEYFITVALEPGYPGDITNMIIEDVLPANMSYAGGLDYSQNDAPVPIPTFAENNGTLTWSWGALVSPRGWSFRVSFLAVVNPGAPAGPRENCFELSNGDGVIVGAGIFSDVCETSMIGTSANLSSKKYVKGSLDDEYSSFPDFGETVPGEKSSYRFVVINEGNVTLQNIEIMDIFPHIGDMAVSAGFNRLSDFQSTAYSDVYFLDNANADPTICTNVMMPQPSDISILYSNETNPCRTNFDPPYSPTGCTGPTWSGITPAPISDLMSFLLTIQGPFAPLDTLVFGIDFIAPMTALPGEIAWNSFAIQGQRMDNMALLPVAEPNKVGVTVPAVLDVALTKSVSSTTPNPLNPGDTVTFDIWVYNQGSVAAEDISIVDYIPTGLTLADPNWLESGGVATIVNNIPSIPITDSTMVTITFTIDAGFTGTSIVNYAEIAAVTNSFDSSLTDVDSTPNADNTDDAGGQAETSADDYIDGDGTGTPNTGVAATDEDDHDPAIVLLVQCNIPVATTFALPPSCTNGIPNPDGYLQISTANDATHYNFIADSDYSTGDADIANATIFDSATDLPLQFGALSNPTGSQDYTIRVFNGASDCFMDYTVTMQEQDCTTGCDCTETIYLNEPTTGGAVHKFAINEADSTLIETGSPWFDNAVEMEGLVSPHGLGADLNGFLYIGEHYLSGYEIRKFSCDGEIFPESEFAVTTTGQTNIVTVGNKLYYNQRNGAGEIIEYDLCAGVETGSVSLCDNSDNRFDWGLYYDKNAEIFYSVGSANMSAQNYFWYYTKDDFLSPDCVEPTPLSAEFPTTNSIIRGVTTDLDGNVYIVVQEDANIANSPSYVLKFGMAPTFTYLATSSLDSIADGIGFNVAIGIVYSETTGKLYVSTGSPVDDCIAEFDTDLNYLGTAVPAPGTSDNGKGIAITKECCPSPLRQTIDETYCMASVGEKLLLNEVFPCDGVVCGAPWVADIGNTGMTYDDCDQSITITATNACATFTKQGSNAQCGAYDLTYNVEVLDITAPVIAGDTPTCANGNNPAAFTITTPAASSSTITYRWQSSTTDCTTGFTDIAGASTDATPYDPPALSQETYYRVITDVNGSCSSGMCADTSNCVTLTPVSLPSLSATPSNPTACGSCDGSISLSFNDVPPGTYTINYEDASGTTQTFDNVTVASGSFQFANITNLCAGTYNNLTITVSGCPSPLGVNVSLIETCDDYDYGDLPDISSGTSALNYQTTSANNGPAHLIISGLHIGASVDSETDGQASTNAYGDGADEDGYNFPANLNISAGGTLNLPINLTNTTGTIAHLEAWIDWNGDGDFDDANEMVIDISDDGAGNFGMTHTPINIPSNAIQSQQIGLRFRLSHTDNMTPYGSVSTGEIEDYLIQIECKSKTCLPVQLTIQKGIN